MAFPAYGRTVLGVPADHGRVGVADGHVRGENADAFVDAPEQGFEKGFVGEDLFLEGLALAHVMVRARDAHGFSGGAALHQLAPRMDPFVGPVLAAHAEFTLEELRFASQMPGQPGHGRAAVFGVEKALPLVDGQVEFVARIAEHGHQHRGVLHSARGDVVVPDGPPGALQGEFPALLARLEGLSGLDEFRHFELQVHDLHVLPLGVENRRAAQQPVLPLGRTEGAVLDRAGPEGPPRRAERVLLQSARFRRRAFLSARAGQDSGRIVRDGGVGPDDAELRVEHGDGYVAEVFEDGALDALLLAQLRLQDLALPDFVAQQAREFFEFVLALAYGVRCVVARGRGGLVQVGEEFPEGIRVGLEQAGGALGQLAGQGHERFGILAQ